MTTMVWDVETWVHSKEDPAKAVKQFVRLDAEPGPNELAELRSKAVGFYRVLYQEWGLGQGQKVSPREIDRPAPPVAELAAD